MRSLERGLAILLGASTFASLAQADVGVRLTVERGAGAAECSNAAELLARVEQLRGASASSPHGAYAVSFTRQSAGFSAAIHNEAGDTTRVLRTRGDHCDSLAQATALTLALLFDAELNAQPPETKPAPATPQAPPPKLDRPVQREAMVREDRWVAVALGAGTLLGVAQALRPALSLEVGVETRRLHGALGALWATPNTSELGPGKVSSWLWAGTARICVVLTGTSALRLESCTGALFGGEHAQAHAFTANRERTRAYLAVPLELAFSARSRRWGFELSSAALLPFQRNDFVVDELGRAYHDAPFAALLSLRALSLSTW